MENTSENIKKTLQIAEVFQNNCHKVVEEVLREKEVSYQDATNVWIFHKLAEFEMRLQSLECAKSYKPVTATGRWKCTICGRDKFTHKAPHKCIDGFRKRNIIWQDLSNH